MQKLLLRVYSSKGLSGFLKILSSFIVFMTALSYAALLFHSFYSSLYEGLSVLLSAAIPFFAISIVRALINAPRPYEMYDFYQIKPKERQGKSYPSRHAYSAFVIATIAYIYSIPFGIGLTLAAALLCFIRVLLGIHFPRDVFAGGLVGIVAGLFGIFFLVLPNIS